MKHQRSVLLFSVLFGVSLLLIAGAPPVVQEVIVTQEVEKVVTQEVEVVVTQEVEVIVTQEVETIVEVPAEGAYPEGTELRILQWSHFVPQYDSWFDVFAEEWGNANGVDVTVDHINIAELPAALAAAIDAGEGPTMVELNLAASNFVEGVRDLTDINMEAQELFGPQAETCTANSYLPANDKWYGYCHAWVPDPGDYDRAMWSEVGFPDAPGPTCWRGERGSGTSSASRWDLVYRQRSTQTWLCGPSSGPLAAPSRMRMSV
jgi:ABC-type glycerol-3-phosphate transport system substrate-binding protein